MQVCTFHHAADLECPSITSNNFVTSCSSTYATQSLVQLLKLLRSFCAPAQEVRLAVLQHVNLLSQSYRTDDHTVHCKSLPMTMATGQGAVLKQETW